MSTFKLERPIPSCLVKKDLLEKLESYLSNEVPQFLNTLPAENNPLSILQQTKFSVSITDNFGTEEVDTMSQYPVPQFPNSTDKVFVILLAGVLGATRIGIFFHKNREDSEISVECKGHNAREKAISIYEGIKRIIDNYSNWNWLYNPKIWLKAVLFGFAVIFLLPAIGPLANYSITAALIVFLSFAALMSYLFLFGRLKPYIAFESTSYYRTKAMADWLFLGILTFIIFGTLFVYFRRAILGF